MAFSDAEIERLLKIPKVITNPKARTLSQRGSDRINYDALGPNGEIFHVFVRQNLRIPNGFSCGLIFESESGATTTLTRYNGSDHEHGNPLEDSKPLAPACHIHRATERYINAGRKADHYAETTDRYNDLVGALKALLEDCNISGLDVEADVSQLKLL